jgi:hypothetical protein
MRSVFSANSAETPSMLHGTAGKGWKWPCAEQKEGQRGAVLHQRKHMNISLGIFSSIGI